VPIHWVFWSCGPDVEVLRPCCAELGGDLGYDVWRLFSEVYRELVEVVVTVQASAVVDESQRLTLRCRQYMNREEFRRTRRRIEVRRWAVQQRWPWLRGLRTWPFAHNSARSSKARGSGLSQV